MRHGSPDVVMLEKSSPAYLAHHTQIQELGNRAMDLHVITDHIRRKMLESAEGVPCKRAQDDYRWSVASLFAREVRNIERNRRNPASDKEYEEDVEDLLRDVLATQFSVIEHQQNGYDKSKKPEHIADYRAQIDEIERLCKEYGLPSLLPIMMSGDELSKELRGKRFTEKKGSQYVLYCLGYFFGRQPHILDAATEALCARGEYNNALDLIEGAAGLSKTTIVTILQRHPGVFNTYIEALFKNEEYGQVAWYCQQVGIQHFRHNQLVCEKYLHSLIQENRIDEAVTVFEHPSVFLRDTDRLRLMQQIGWMYFGTDRASEGISFVDKHANGSLGPNGLGDVNTLYEQLTAARDGKIVPAMEKHRAAADRSN